MKSKPWICCRALLFLFLTIVPAFSRKTPVTDNLRQLTEQEDTDGDQKITIRDHTTPSVLRGQTGGVVRTLTDSSGEVSRKRFPFRFMWHDRWDGHYNLSERTARRNAG